MTPDEKNNALELYLLDIKYGKSCILSIASLSKGTFLTIIDNLNKQTELVEKFKKGEKMYDIEINILKTVFTCRMNDRFSHSKEFLNEVEKLTPLDERF
jgi:ribosome biogenesis protein Tsr3